MKTEYKISVILPVYNVEKYILRCLKALKVQTFQDFEIIIVDDCGSDNSIAITKEYTKNDNRVKIIYNNKNTGTYHARRIGVESAIGEYIVFLDPDDELDKYSLELIYEQFFKSKAKVLFYGVKLIPNPKWYNSKSYMYPQMKDDSLLVSFFSKGAKNYLWGTPGKAFDRQFLIKVYESCNIKKNFRFVYAEDIFLLLNAMFFRPKYTILKYNGYILYRNPTSITNQHSPEIIAENIKQYDFMVENIDKNIKSINLSKKENKIYKMLKRKFLADRFLLIRNIEPKKYFIIVMKSFLLVPNIRKFIRLVVYLFSFGKKRP